MPCGDATPVPRPFSYSFYISCPVVLTPLDGACCYGGAGCLVWLLHLQCIRTVPMNRKKKRSEYHPLEMVLANNSPCTVGFFASYPRARLIFQTAWSAEYCFPEKRYAGQWLLVSKN